VAAPSVPCNPKSVAADWLAVPHDGSLTLSNPFWAEVSIVCKQCGLVAWPLPSQLKAPN
jgi:hypothetical protein